MTPDQFRAWLRRQCKPTIAAWAGPNGFAASFVSNVINGKSPPSPRMLAALGVERVVSYRRVTR